MSTNSNWFLAEAVDVERPSERALYLVFRGTNSPTDAIADVLFRPDDAPNGVQCHGGFLRTVRDDKALHATLAQHAAGDMALYVMGHSLGGALSQTLVGAGLLPPTFAGRLTVVTLGGPVVFYGAVKPSMLPEVAVGARVLSVVNANDIVPRLLGCPLSFTRRLLVLFASSASPRQQQRNEAILDTLEKYNGYPQVCALRAVASCIAPTRPRVDRALALPSRAPHTAHLLSRVFPGRRSCSSCTAGRRSRWHATTGCS